MEYPAMNRKQRVAPKMRVRYAVYDKYDNKLHEGSFNLNDYGERLAFNERCVDAWKNGLLILTWSDDKE